MSEKLSIWAPRDPALLTNGARYYDAVNRYFFVFLAQCFQETTPLFKTLKFQEFSVLLNCSPCMVHIIVSSCQFSSPFYARSKALTKKQKCGHCVDDVLADVNQVIFAL